MILICRSGRRCIHAATLPYGTNLRQLDNAYWIIMNFMRYVLDRALLGYHHPTDDASSCPIVPRHESAGGLGGRLTSKQAPPPSRGTQCTSPPWRRAI